jgi:hypothetical protein
LINEPIPQQFATHIHQLISKTRRFLYDKANCPYLLLTSYNKKYFKECLLHSYNDAETGKYRTNDFLRKYVFKNLTQKINEDLELCENVSKKYLYLKLLFSAITDKTYFVLITADKHFSAATLFETLNFRGAILGVSDLFKSLVFSKAIEQRKQRDVDELWREIIEILDQQKISLTEFLRHFWISQNAKIIEGSLYKIFRRELEEDGVEIVTYLKKIRKSLKIYVDILKPKNKARWKNNNKIESNLLAICKLKVKESYPFLLSLFLQKATEDMSAEEKKAINKLLGLIENVAFRLIICKKTTSYELEKIFAEFSKRIHNNILIEIDNMIKALKKVAPDDRSFERDFSEYSSSNYNMSFYILYNLEKLNRGKKEALSDNRSEITIEHIMPKKLGHGWSRVANYHKEFLNKLGNLTLLGKGLNVTNKTFNKKKEEFYKKSTVTLTIGLIAYSQWRKSEIIARQKQMARTAVMVWAV